MPVDLDNLSGEELDSLSREKTFFLLPIGSLDDHGTHLPMSMGSEIAHGVAQKLGQRIESEFQDWKVVLLPVLPLSVETHTSIGIQVRPYVLRDWLVDACLSLSKLGFSHFGCVSGNWSPRQLTATEEAGKILARKFSWRLRGHKRPRLYSLSSAWVDAKDFWKSPISLDAEEHGGEIDTSIALYLIPNQVKPLYTNLAPLERETSTLLHRLKKWQGKLRGYWGSPAEAQAEKGSHWTHQRTERIFSRLRLVLEGAPPRSRFRSWFSLVPLNWSYFKGWILFILIFLMMLLWAGLVTRVNASSL